MSSFFRANSEDYEFLEVGVSMAVTSLGPLSKVWSGVFHTSFDPNHSFYEHDILSMMIMIEDYKSFCIGKPLIWMFGII